MWFQNRRAKLRKSLDNQPTFREAQAINIPEAQMIHVPEAQAIQVNQPRIFWPWE